MYLIMKLLNKYIEMHINLMAIFPLSPLIVSLSVLVGQALIPHSPYPVLVT